MSKDMQLTEIMSEYITCLDESSITRDVLEHSKTAFLDWLGCVIGGHEDPVVRKTMKFAQLIGGHEQSTVFFSKHKMSMLHAACVNGASAHILGYDDTVKIYIGHSSAVLFPGLLSLSEWKEATGLEFLMAHIAAFKIASVLGSIAGMQAYKKGWWTTTTVGGVASAAGCSRILNLSAKQTRAALGIASNMASGLKSVFGSEAKAFHAGYTSGTGITAALVAGENLTCSDGMLEGTDGYVQVFEGELKPDMQNLFERIWEFDELAQKYHVSCHFTHSAVEAVLRVMEEESLNSREIKKINVTVSDLAFRAASKSKIESVLDAKFSISYCISNAILRKNTGMHMFTDELIRDKNVLEFMDRIILSSNDYLKAMETQVSIEKKDGSVASITVDVFNEIPGIEVKKERIIKKFFDICIPFIADKTIEDIIHDVMQLESVSNMRPFVENLNNILIAKA